jgi:hypothetical protein
MVLYADPKAVLYSTLFAYLACGCAFAPVPQIVLIVKSKQVHNISIPLFICWTLGEHHDIEKKNFASFPPAFLPSTQSS